MYYLCNPTQLLFFYIKSFLIIVPLTQFIEFQSYESNLYFLKYCCMSVLGYGFVARQVG